MVMEGCEGTKLELLRILRDKSIDVRFLGIYLKVWLLLCEHDDGLEEEAYILRQATKPVQEREECSIHPLQQTTDG